MRTIWKYPLVITDEQIIRMPRGANVLSVANQDGVLTLWADVDPEAEKEPTVIAIYGIGNPIAARPSDEYHLGTVQMGPYVWHCFARFPDESQTRDLP